MLNCCAGVFPLCAQLRQIRGNTDNQLCNLAVAQVKVLNTSTRFIDNCVAVSICRANVPDILIRDLRD